MRAPDFVRQVEIHAPAERVWAVLADVERWPLWTASISRVNLYTGAPIEVGSRAIVKQPRFPTAQWIVTDVESGRGFTWVSIGPGLTVTGDHRIEPIEGGCRVTLTLTYEGLLARLIMRLTRGITARYVEMEAAGLKARSEA